MTTELDRSRFDIIQRIGMATGVGLFYTEGTVSVTSTAVELSDAIFPITPNDTSWRMEFYGDLKKHDVTTLTDNNSFVLSAAVTNNLPAGTRYMLYRVKDEELLKIDAAIRAGLNQYYHPTSLVPQIGKHQWSFLFPTMKMELASGQRFYDTPPDWGRPHGDITFSGAENSFYDPIKHVSRRTIETMEPVSDSTGTPTCYAVYNKSNAGIGPQRKQLGFHQTPDQDYEVSIEYEAAQRNLTNVQPYPLGGEAHAEGITLSCIHKAHEIIDGVSHPDTVNARAAFIDRLAADVAADLQNAPRFLGTNEQRYAGEEAYDFESLVYNKILVTGDITYSG